MKVPPLKTPTAHKVNNSVQVGRTVHIIISQCGDIAYTYSSINCQIRATSESKEIKYIVMSRSHIAR
jgi:hypothetical protein